MNIENLTKLRDWLIAGAPHAYFHMEAGLVINELSDEHKSSCGTTCCIGGAAYEMSLSPTGDLPTVTELLASSRHQPGGDGAASYALPWEHISRDALEWLGIPENGGFFRHDLFNPDLAPKACTPQEAAEAVQRVMDGLEPWPEEEI